MIANMIWEVLEENRYQNDMMIIGGDPQPTYTDPKKGVYHHIQEKRGRRLTVAVCMLASLKQMLHRFIDTR